MATNSWTTPADVVRKLRRRWDRGDFLTADAAGVPWEPLSVGLRGPSARELASRFADVQTWVRTWQDTPRRLRVEWTTVGGRVIGANEIPSRALVDSCEQLWPVLGVQSDVRDFDALLNATRHRAHRLAEWMVTRPLEALRFAEVWPALLDTVLWIESHEGSEMYLRQVDVPGVDTKFIEGHRKVLATLLDQQLAAERVDTTRPVSDFAGRSWSKTRSVTSRSRT